MNVKRMYVSLSAALLLMLSVFITEQTTAASNNHYLPLDDQTEITLSSGSVTANNEGDSAALTIGSYDQSFAFADIEAVQVIEKDGVEYITAVIRYAGNGNTFSVKTLINDAGKVEEVHDTGEWGDATYELTDRGFSVNQLIEEEEENPLVFKAYYTYENQKVTQNQGFNDSRVKQEAFSLQSKTDVKVVGENPSAAEINQLLTEAAKAYDVPPEVVKSIAYIESNWGQYWDDGNIPEQYMTQYQSSCTPEAVEKANKDKLILAWDGTNVKLGFDCIGIGFMQVSDWRNIENETAREEYVAELKSDIVTNIEEGLIILNEKWENQFINFDDGEPHFPKVNDQDRRMIDNWYFAVMAYNGVSQRNDPTQNPGATYQDKVFNLIESNGLIEISDFPVDQLTTSYSPGGYIRFNQYQVNTPAPISQSKIKLMPGQSALIFGNGGTNTPLRSLTNPDSILDRLPELTKVKILDQPIAYPTANRLNHFHYVPVETESGQKGYVASSYVSPLSVSLEGLTRYETAASISDYGWDNTETDTVVIGRGDLPIDALTGSVFAASKNAPLLLTRTDQLMQPVIDELKRLKPQNVFILGGEPAISKEVESQIDAMKFGEQDVKVFRVAGETRYSTAVSIAEQFAGTTVDEVFLTTGNEKSPDALSIAAYAGSQGKPIMITRTEELRQEVINYIKERKVSKVTIIGGPTAVSKKVEDDLKKLVTTVERVSGDDRYETSIAIADKYYPQLVNRNDVFVARGDIIVDALSGSALAGRYGTPLILTRSTSAPAVTEKWLSSYNKELTKPVLHFLGTTDVISASTRTTLEKAALK
ncbi:hypothetical protein JMA_29580 [Jeotgalibacillus malaysiensis]|uniref:Uncharacterized protein n=1 Tax=Jeotgalibacillus malaysiensis TaxID=1508404 RepID=A0A0B5APX0_9BACL|nr:cell wall-binding repeat-containing protein [Jeotgalibacillus malaysiensis]AJD92275.1 hypothetical protein JMA_29580 [Jeotgalibacillus malaysiensis]